MADIIYFALVLTTILLWTQEAYAYFDPGTGSLLLQVLVALLGGVLVFYHKILSKAKKLSIKLKFFTARDGRLPIKEYCVLAATIGSYVGIFYTNHHHSLSITALLLNTFLFSLVSVGLTGVFILVLNKEKHQEKIVHGLLFVMFIYYMRIPVAENMQILYIDFLDHHPSSAIVPIVSLLLGSIFFGLGCLLSGNTYKVVFIIAILSLLPLFNVAKSLYFITSERNAQHVDVISSIIDDREIVFKHKQNVYFLLFDGYTNTEGLQALGLSASSVFNDYLSKNSFVVYPQFYTNAQRTREALSSYFNMDIKLRGKNIYNNFHISKQITVSGNSSVFNIFKKNGYSTKIIMVDQEWFSLNEYLRGAFCFADHCLGHKHTNLFLTNLKLIDHILFNKIMANYAAEHIDHVDNAMSVLHREIDSEVSQFVYAHFLFPAHAKANHVDDKGTCDERIETREYAKRIFHTNNLIVEKIGMIRQLDPEALVVIASDHGPIIFNRCAYSAPLLTWEEVVERQSVFLAIRWGDDYDGRYDRDIKTSANLFRYIFSYLMGHEELLKSKANDDAFYPYKGEVIKSIDDGVIIPPPEAKLRGNE